MNSRLRATAQEESLARASALYACRLAVPEFYEFHRRQKDLRYTDRIIYSPAACSSRQPTSTRSCSRCTTASRAPRSTRPSVTSSP
jgi:hypothetical protein